jgi:hypothetical protein
VYVLHDVSETKGATRTVLSKIAIPLSHNTTAAAAASTVLPAIAVAPTEVTTYVPWPPWARMVGDVSLTHSLCFLQTRGAR